MVLSIRNKERPPPRLSTWEVLAEVDRLMRHVKDWKPSPKHTSNSIHAGFDPNKGHRARKK